MPSPTPGRDRQPRRAWPRRSTPPMMTTRRGGRGVASSRIHADNPLTHALLRSHRRASATDHHHRCHDHRGLDGALLLGLGHLRLRDGAASRRSSTAEVADIHAVRDVRPAFHGGVLRRDRRRRSHHHLAGHGVLPSGPQAQGAPLRHPDVHRSRGAVHRRRHLLLHGHPQAPRSRGFSPRARDRSARPRTPRSTSTVSS